MSWFIDRLSEPEPLLIPGAYDALSAKLVESAGFDAVYVGGYSVAASTYGLPDIGMVTGGEMLDALRRIRAVTELPMVVDADNGYGGPVNVARTVEQLKRLGVAALHLEDQATPKRCGHMEDKRVVTLEEAVQRVRAAVWAAGTDGPAIIARTDALQPEGLASVLDRVRAYEEAGGAALFVDAPATVDELRAIRGAVRMPLVFNAATTDKSPQLSAAEIAELGYGIIIYPNQLVYAAFRGVTSWLQALPAAPVVNSADGLPTFAAFNAFLGVQRYAEWDAQVAAGVPAGMAP